MLMRQWPALAAGVAAIVAGLPAASFAGPTSVQRFGQVWTVKVRMPTTSVTPQLLSSGVRVVANYGSFTIIEAPLAAVPTSDGAEVLPDENRILLHAGIIDTTQPAAQLLQQARAPFAGKALQLVQFAGPVQPAWRDALMQTGVQIVTYIPSNTYLVYGDSGQVTALQALAAGDSHIQWQAPYLDAYKIHPAALPQNNHGNDLFAIQLIADPQANPATLAVVDRLKSAPILSQYSILNYVNIVAKLPLDKITELSAQPDVVFIHPYVVPVPLCERQDQIVAGNLNTGPGNTFGPGYLDWLALKGFTQAQFDLSGFVVDVSDSGIDNGTSTPNHFALYPGGVIGPTSRVAYNDLFGTPDSMHSTVSGCDGHGNIDAHIIGGFIPNGFTTAPHADALGFRYGLGVAPFIKVGSSVIFDYFSAPGVGHFTSPDFSELQSQAYENNARISSNSWGARVNGAYDMSCQTYDALVRDAQPAGSFFGQPGNQEMVIVFANGNAGPNAGTVGSPATAKNVISVGAAQNVQAFGGSDGCGTPDSQAESANELAQFSSRGPCADGRHKPDIVAPGTHVSGGVAQAASPGPTGTADPCFTGFSVCGGFGSIFFPAGQQFYTASSGTSHACPAVAGGCALIRQFFINQGMAPPSPAMTKALLVNSARWMSGTGDEGFLWSNGQGMGEMNLGEAFNRGTVTRTVFRDQVVHDPPELDDDLFTAAGQMRTFSGTVQHDPEHPDRDKPLRVTLAWTDFPGPLSSQGPALMNDLNLTVTIIGGSTYKGNVFSGTYSCAGGDCQPPVVDAADNRNNVESVFVLPSQSAGRDFTVIVTAANISADAVNIGSGSFSQDFALIIDNVSCPAISLGPTTALADLVVNTHYSQQLTATGGTGPYTFTKVPGTPQMPSELPPGVTLSPTGLISGTPTLSGKYTFTVRATDAVNCKGDRPYSISPRLVFSPFPPMGTCVKEASAPLGPEPLVTGGSAPYTYTWSKLSGPSNFDPAVIHDAHPTLKPPTAQDYVLQVVATDSSQPPKTIVMTAPFLVGEKVRIDEGLYTKYHPILTIGETLEFGKEFSASGGRLPYTFDWSIVDDPNGFGVLMNPDTREASFTTSQPGTYTIMAEVREGAGCVNQTRFSLTAVSTEPQSKSTGGDGTGTSGGTSSGACGLGSSLCGPTGVATLSGFMLGYGWLRALSRRRRRGR